MIGLLGLFLDQAGHRHRAARRNFQRGFRAAGLDRGNGQRHCRHRLVSVIELSFDSSDTSVITRRLIRPSVSTTGVKLSEMPNFLKLIWVRTDTRDRVAGIAGGDRKFAAGDEGRGLAGDRRQVRFGQRAHHAGAFHRAQRRLHRRQSRLSDA